MTIGEHDERRGSVVLSGSMKAVLALTVAVLGAGDIQAEPDTTPIALQPGQRQLFLDDFVIAELSGLVRTMHRAEKRGSVVRPDIPTDGTLIQTRGEPVWSPEDAEYKLVYYAYGGGVLGTGMALATSKDGLHWTKPLLGLVEVQGNTTNNWITIDPTVVPPNRVIDGVVYDPDEKDLDRRYKTLLGAINRRPAVSADCVHWTRIGTTEISSSDESHFLYDRDRRQFHAIVKTSNVYGRAFAIASSSDFEHWTPNRPLFGADAEDQKMAPDIIRRRLDNPNMLGPLFVEPRPSDGAKPPDGSHQPVWRAEVYNIGVFPYEGLYIGLPSMYYPTGTCLPARNNTDGFHVIQLVMSRDLEHWARLGERQPFIEPSGIEHGRIGVYDRTQILAANRPILREDELWIYYSGLKWRDPIYELNPDGTPRDPSTLTEDDRADMKDGWGAICLAVLRRDGFISLDAAGDGRLLTKPLQLAGRRLFLNISAPKGQALVEIVGLDGSPKSGYAQSDAIPVTGDAVCGPVSWKKEADIARLSGQTVRLKIYMKSAQLYAFWTE
jgi:hypothetical protein